MESAEAAFPRLPLYLWDFTTSSGALQASFRNFQEEMVLLSPFARQIRACFASARGRDDTKQALGLDAAAEERAVTPFREAVQSLYAGIRQDFRRTVPLRRPIPDAQDII